MIYYRFEMNYNQKKRFAFLRREVKKLKNEEINKPVWIEEAIQYNIDLEGIKKYFSFNHPIELLAFYQKYNGNNFIQSNKIIQDICLHDIAILGICHFDYHKDYISKFDLAQLNLYEDNILKMIESENKSISEQVKEYYAENEIQKKPKELKIEDIKGVMKNE